MKTRTPAPTLLSRVGLAALWATAVLGLLWGVLLTWAFYDFYWEHREAFEGARGYFDEDGVFHTDSTFVYGILAIPGYVVAFAAAGTAVWRIRRRRWYVDETRA